MPETFIRRAATRPHSLFALLINNPLKQVKGRGREREWERGRIPLLAPKQDHNHYTTAADLHIWNDGMAEDPLSCSLVAMVVVALNYPIGILTSGHIYPPNCTSLTTSHQFYSSLLQQMSSSPSSFLPSSTFPMVFFKLMNFMILSSVFVLDNQNMLTVD